MDDSIVFDRAAGFYDATRGFPPGVEERVADAFVAAGGLGPASRVLEVGVGTGRIALPLAERVGHVVGVDRSAPMLAKLVEKRGPLPIALARADAGRLPLPDASVEAAVAVHVFHLIPGWRAVLAELARVLRPGGLLLHGGDDHARGEAWRRWRARTEAQFGVENVGVPRARIETFLEEEGWRPAGVETVRFARRTRPRTLLDLIEGRSWSLTWRMSDTQLAEAVSALREDLVAAFGDLDREVEIETGFWVRAYQAA
ncbi:MAG TPA: methyltransferase domain-containing protein [Myxococcota bacterium]|nr:methyltransferase domain-containing protein [Myxococcota bacterium]